MTENPEAEKEMVHQSTYKNRCINNKKFLFACTLYLDQQPSVEQPQQEKPPAEIQDITPRKEEVHGEDPVNRDEEEEKDPFEDSGLEAALQQLALAKTGGEGGDGPDVREEFASNIEPVEMPEAGNHEMTE
ncbi:hypothetical protein E5288_WYG003492 [Bos mutus]|uniref:GAGE domain-containing protein n=1 Tax=Bos mutus TaxID=72004 RepID=A0A6B0SF84_9CETA|nr:hypothetical protein [Bos mutus]